MAFDAAVARYGLSSDASAAEFLRFIVNFAILAPSGHNTQPWLFRVRDEELQLLADRTRALPVVDPHDRALTISCGAALEHLLLAARRFGRELAIDELPGVEPDHLATVRVRETISPGPEDIALFDAMPARRTTRTKFYDRALPAALLDACCKRAEENRTALTIVADRAQRARVADLVAEGDRLQFSDPGFRQELAAWIHSRRGATRDGMSGESFGMPDLLSPVGALVIRTFDLGNGVAANDRKKIIEGSPVLAVFSSENDEMVDWLATGRALSRVLLTLAAAGATASFLNQPVEVDALRPRLARLAGTAWTPQLLLRFGYAAPAPATVRRPIEEVLVEDDRVAPPSAALRR